MTWGFYGCICGTANRFGFCAPACLHLGEMRRQMHMERNQRLCDVLMGGLDKQLLLFRIRHNTHQHAHTCSQGSHGLIQMRITKEATCKKNAACL